VCAAALAGCATVNPLEQAGNDFGKGFLASMDKDAPKTVDALVKRVGDDIRTDVLTDETNEKLATTVSAIGAATAAQLPRLRDEALGKATEAELRKILVTLLAVMDAQSKRTVRGMMGEVGTGVERNVLSPGTERRLNEMLESLGATARDQSRLMRDDILSPDTDQQLRIIIATAMDEVVSASERIREKAHAELSFAQRNANISIVIACLVGAALAYVTWRQKEKNRVLLELLLAQVHAVSGDREQEIHARVLEQAKHLGAHGQLRAMLARQGKGGKAEEEKAKEEKDRKVA
jgi:hypothetical protein